MTTLLLIAVFNSAEHEKKRKYSMACQGKRATFTPLCVSVDGMMGRKATALGCSSVICQVGQSLAMGL